MTIGSIAFTRQEATGTTTIEFIQKTAVLKPREIPIVVYSHSQGFSDSILRRTEYSLLE